MLVAIGVYTIGMERLSLTELSRPIRAVRSDRATQVALLSIVFAVLLGGHFLREKNRFVRIASSGVIFLGAYLIAIAD